MVGLASVSSKRDLSVDRMASTPIERYFASPRHGSGMVFDARLQLGRCLDISKLQTAWLETVQQTPPIFGFWTGKGQHAHWKVPPLDQSRFGIEVVESLDRRKWIDGLRPERGVSAKLIVVRSSVELESSLWFFFHHVACDGVGAVRIISRTLQLYDHELNRRKSFLNQTPTEVEQSPDTSVGFPDVRHVWSTIRGRNLRVDLSHSRPTAPRGLLASVPTHDEDVSCVDTPTHQRLTFSYERSRQIRQRLRAHPITLNDWAVAVSLHALAESHHAKTRRYVCVMNPVQTRTWKQRRETRNQIGFAYIRRRVNELGSLWETLDSVSKELVHIRSNSIAEELSVGLGIFEKIPGALNLIEKTGWFCPTASVTCLTNLKFGKRHGMSRKVQKQEAVRGTDLPKSNQVPPSTFVADTELKDVELIGPLQAGGKLAITMWDVPQGISVTFRHADPSVQFRCREIAQRWSENFLTPLEMGSSTRAMG